jgi:RHS repeat-associated protein
LAVVLAASTPSETTRFVHGPHGLERQQQNSGAWLFPVGDGLGSVRGMLDNDWPDSDVLGTRQYAPYGVPFGAEGTVDTPFGFTGEQVDGNDLVYLRARYYAPGLGVFIGLDPVEFPNQYVYVISNPTNDAVGELPVVPMAMSLNRYMYAAGNVVNLVDPSGMFGEMPWQDPCWQAPDPCSECIQNYLNNLPNQDSRIFWGIYYNIAVMVCSDVCPTFGEAGWRLPMDGAALTEAGCLSRRVASTFVPCSRDVNPRNQSGPGHSVYAPNPHGIVWYAGEGGFGLGNVVILKYSVDSLPTFIQSKLPQSSESASLFIQYAHLSSDSVSSGDPIPDSGLEIGLSGATGGDYAPHLDITVIWIPDEDATSALGRTNFIEASDWQQWNILTTNLAAHDARWTIDPLSLWPKMGWSTDGEDVPPNLCQPETDCNAYSP